MTLAKAIRTIPDYPKKGILFRDITTLLGDAHAFRQAVDELTQPWVGKKLIRSQGLKLAALYLEALSRTNYPQVLSRSGKRQTPLQDHIDLLCP